jgi:hypothetical protein
MTASPRRHPAIAAITILAIAGTLSSCGRYGKPVRAASVENPTLESPVSDDVETELETDEETLDRTRMTQ